MPLYDWFILMGMGGLFVLLGLAAIIWGKSEEKSYYDSLSTRADLREFLEHQPQWPQPVALKIGGWIAVAVGLVMLAMGGAIFLWG
ncbi:unnamed protein product [marine sediment metagenome]|uniref:Uncharacterized protein n=1 Tax=marine sediment metagenome TaxID=412755 RepID=X0W3L5_9ZZZZ